MSPLTVKKPSYNRHTSRKLVDPTRLMFITPPIISTATLLQNFLRSFIQIDFLGGANTGLRQISVRSPAKNCQDLNAWVTLSIRTLRQIEPNYQVRLC